MNGQSDSDGSGSIFNLNFSGRAEVDESGENIGVAFRDENTSVVLGDDNTDSALGDANHQDDGKKISYQRFTPEQIQELEKLFKECPHPSHTQKMELGQRLNLDGNKIRFWFQKRWLATLQRYYESLSTLSSINVAEVYRGKLSSKSAAEMVKLAQRMTLNYYSGITGSSARCWQIINDENEEENMRLMTRKNENEIGEHTGVVLSAATSIWFPVNQQTIFGFLSNTSVRHQWDILTDKTFTVEANIHIRKENSPSNNISLLQIREKGMQVLQETWSDESGSLLVYAPVEADLIEKVVRGEEDSDMTKILPSGFSILPDGSSNGGGCMLTMGLQILVSSEPNKELNQDVVEATKKLMASTIGKIKSVFA